MNAETANAAPTQPEKSVTFVVPAHATGDFGDGPSFAEFNADESFLKRLDEVAALCNQRGFSEVRYGASPTWGPGNVEKDLRLQYGEIVVMRTGRFMFTDSPEVGDYQIQSRDHSIAAIREAFAAAGDTETVFFGLTPKQRDIYVDDKACHESASLKYEAPASPRG